VPVVLAGVEHYSQKEVQDVLAICQLLLNPADEHLLKHCLRAARVVSGGDLVLLEAAMETGQEPSCIPSVAGADPDVTARLAKSLLGHPGRKAQFLQGPLQDLNDLIRELRMALLPPGRAKGKAGKTNLHRPKDATLRACLLLNGVAFLENGSAVWSRFARSRPGAETIFESVFAVRWPDSARGGTRGGRRGTTHLLFQKLRHLQPDH